MDDNEISEELKRMEEELGVKTVGRGGKSSKPGKQVVYKASMRNFYAPAAVVGVFIFLLMRMGVGLILDRGQILESDIVIIAMIPIVLALLFTAILIVTYIRNSKRSIIFTLGALKYDSGRGTLVSMGWNTFQCATAVKPDKSIFDYTQVSDGTQSFIYERFFFPDYDRITANIKSMQSGMKSVGFST